MVQVIKYLGISKEKQAIVEAPSLTELTEFGIVIAILRFISYINKIMHHKDTVKLIQYICYDFSFPETKNFRKM